jgi:hypothetical protein
LYATGALASRSLQYIVRRVGACGCGCRRRLAPPPPRRAVLDDSARPGREDPARGDGSPPSLAVATRTISFIRELILPPAAPNAALEPVGDLGKSYVDRTRDRGPKLARFARLLVDFGVSVRRGFDLGHAFPYVRCFFFSFFYLLLLENDSSPPGENISGASAT